MNKMDLNAPINKKDFSSLGFNDVPNLSIKNLNFYFTELAIGGYNFKNTLIYNCEFRHVRTAFSILFINDVVVDHCFIEDTAADGCGFGGNNVTIQNNIIRHVGVVPPFGFAINFWSGNNYTYILNNDISDGNTLIFFGGGDEYNVEIYKSVYIENNHIHHGGYRIVDDLASMFFGRHPRGVVINHNKIHDFYANNYCGNGIYPDTGSSGTTVTNNLVYNLSHSAFNLNYGKEHDVYNNIMALCRAGFSFGGYHTDSYTLNLTRNIVYLNRDDSYPIEGPLLNQDIINYFDNNIYYKSNNREITIAGKKLQEWQQLGYDANSLEVDPMFTDPENGDFTFKSKENADKIGFKEFNMAFGVIGDEWRLRAENYTYHDPIIRTHELPLIGFESFENGDDTYFLRRGRIDKNVPGVIVEITEEKACTGTHSFKIQHIEDKSRYSFNFPTYFRNGTAEFSIMAFVNKESSFVLDFGVGWIFMKEGELRITWVLGDLLGHYPINKWFKFGVRADVGESIKSRGKPKFTLIVDDGETAFDVPFDDFKYFDYITITSEGNGTAYLDDFNSTTNQYVEPYFVVENDDDEDTGSKPVESSPDKIDTDDDDDERNSNTNENGPESSNNNKKGLKTGQKIGIAFGVIAAVAICVVAAIFLVRKMKKEPSETLYSID